VSVLDDASAETPSFNADLIGVYEVSLIVTYADGNDSLVDTVTITASEAVPGGCSYSANGSYDMLLIILLACGLFYGRNALLVRK
jgi:hypothetical protein